MNLSNQLVINSKQMNNKKCLINDDESVTYQDLYGKVAGFSKYLKSLGLKKGDKILVLVPMSIDLYITLLSVWAIGATACFMDAGFIKSGMKNNDFADISAVIGITKFILYSNINSNLKKLKLKINVNKISSRDILEIEDLDENFPAIMTYTSGSTGKPKVAARSHRFLYNQGQILEKYLNYDDGDIELSTIPIFTLSNINIGITTVIANAKFTNLGDSNPKKIVSQIKEKNINRLMASPGLLSIIMNYLIENNITLDNVKKVFTGGGAVFFDFIQKVKLACPNAKITTIYGSTEAEPIAELDVSSITESEIQRTKDGYGIFAGKIIGVDDLKLIKPGLGEIGEISEEDFPKLMEEFGEIVVSGCNVLEGYVGGFGDKENKFKVNGKVYHRTGDLGMLDENGNLWLRGRIKEPFFDIEAALHASLNIGKTAVLENDGKIILVLENKDVVSKEDIKNIIKFRTIDEIKYVKKIPVDKRHSTKVDYKSLKEILGI